MNNSRKRLIFSITLNIIMVILFISSIILEIIDIQTNPDSVYQNIWGLFRFFTIDGNLISFIFNIIILVKQFKVLKSSNEETIKQKTVTHFLFIISLISACNDIIIFVVVMLIFCPMSDKKTIVGLIGSYKASSVHITIPVLINFRFLFLDRRERELKLIEKFFGGIPMLVYGVIMFILVGAKAFTSYDKDEGDGKIPYPFLDIHHQRWYFCTFIALFIIIFGFGINFLFNFLNKKCENCLFSIESIGEIGEIEAKDDEGNEKAEREEGAE